MSRFSNFSDLFRCYAGRFVKKTLTVAICSLGFGYIGATSALALTTISSTDIGETWDASWVYASGTSMEGGAWILGENINLMAELTLTGYDAPTETFDFDLKFTNNSGGAVMTAWGFGTDPFVDAFTLPTAPNTSWTTAMGPSGSDTATGTSLSTVNECATTGNNCNGGDPNAGIISPGGVGFFQFSLDFAVLDPNGQFDIFDAYARLQSVDGSGCVEGSTLDEFNGNACSLKLLANTPFTPRSGPPVTVVPVPASLPLFATGLIGLGLIARKRRKAA